MSQHRHSLTAVGRLAMAGLAAILAVVPAFAQHPDIDDEKPTNDTCLTCHDTVQTAMGAKPHKAIAIGCQSCHDLKAAKTPFLRLGEVNTLCRVCHTLPALPPGTRPAPTIAIGDGFTFDRAAMAQVRPIDLDEAGRGHPMAGHPTSGASDPLKKDRPFNCVSCHAPHGSPNPKLIAFELKPGEGICQKCHKMAPEQS